MDPEQFDRNNADLVAKIDELVDDANADATALTNHKTGNDHDTQYYTKQQVDEKVTVVDDKVAINIVDIVALDGRLDLAEFSINALQEDDINTANAIDALQTVLENEIGISEARDTLRQQDIAGHNTRITTAENSIIQLQNTAVTMGDDIADLEVNLTNHGNTIGEIQADIISMLIQNGDFTGTWVGMTNQDLLDILSGKAPLSYVDEALAGKVSPTDLENNYMLDPTGYAGSLRETIGNHAGTWGEENPMDYQYFKSDTVSGFYSINEQLADMLGYTTINAVTNTYTLNLGSKPVKNFRITTDDAVAKTIVITNVPADAEFMIELTYTNAATITWPAGITWLNGVPTFTAGKKYRIMLFTSNGGTTWNGASIGGW